MSELDLPQIAEAQASAYLTSNDADAALEMALCEGKLDHDATGGSFALTAAMFRENWFHEIGGSPAASFVITVPLIKRPFMVRNASGQDCTVSTGSGSTLVLADGECRLAYGDGSQIVSLSDTAAAPVSGSFSGALLSLGSDFTVSHNSLTSVDWSAAVYDTDSYFSGGSPSLLTVPAGVSKVIVRAQIRWQDNATNIREFVIFKNASGAYTGRPYVVDEDRAKLIQRLTSPVLAVSPGDNLSCEVYQDTGGSLNVLSNDATWFSIEAVG